MKKTTFPQLQKVLSTQGRAAEWAEEILRAVPQSGYERGNFLGAAPQGCAPE